MSGVWSERRAIRLETRCQLVAAPIDELADPCVHRRRIRTGSAIGEIDAESVALDRNADSWFLVVFGSSSVWAVLVASVASQVQWEPGAGALARIDDPIDEEAD